MANTFPCIAVMELEAVSFIAGTNQVWTYNVYDDSGSTVDISACTTYLTLSPYGNPDYVAMSVPGTLSGSSTPYQFIVTTGSASRSLSSKYIQQAVVVDFTGEEYRAGQGECTIRPRIASEEAISDESLPSSLALNFAGMSDGVVPTLSGSTWSVSSGCVINTPSTGSELLTDPSLEANYTSGSKCDSLTSYSSPILLQSSNAHSGSKAQQMQATTIYSQIVYPLTSQPSDTWYRSSVWGLVSSGSTGTVRYSFRDSVGALNPSVITITSASYTQLIVTGSLSGSGTIFCSVYEGGTASFDTVIVDDFSIKTISISSMFAVDQFSTSYGILKAAWSIASGVQAGVVMCLDDPTNPQNMITCYHNRTNLVFSKRVAGVVTTLISSAVTYVAGATVEIRRVWGTNVFRAYYNGSQVGTDQTISDSTIINNKYHGLFSTDSQNKCSSFSFYGV